jgi:retinol dehydrogenase-12
MLDMSLFASVISFGRRLSSLTRLGAFLANAGIDVLKYERFEGHESTVTVNVISTLLISMLAVLKLRETSKMQREPGRLTFTGSVIHIVAKHQQPVQPMGHIFSSLDDDKKADMQARYNLSKPMALLAVRQFAKQLSASNSKESREVITVAANRMSDSGPLGWSRSPE